MDSQHPHQSDDEADDLHPSVRSFVPIEVSSLGPPVLDARRPERSGRPNYDPDAFFNRLVDALQSAFGNVELVLTVVAVELPNNSSTYVFHSGDSVAPVRFVDDEGHYEQWLTALAEPFDGDPVTFRFGPGHHGAALESRLALLIDLPASWIRQNAPPPPMDQSQVSPKQAADPQTVADLVRDDDQVPLDPETLHEWLWDALWNQYDFETDLPDWSKPVREYLAVWSVRNYVGNGGLDGPIDALPLLLPAAQSGYQAIGKPAAAEAVGRMIEARDYLALAGDQADYEKLEAILAPDGTAPDWEEFDAANELAAYMRANRSDFLACTFPL